jgi:hypothetical protein
VETPVQSVYRIKADIGTFDGEMLAEVDAADDRELTVDETAGHLVKGFAT